MRDQNIQSAHIGQVYSSGLDQPCFHITRDTEGSDGAPRAGTTEWGRERGQRLKLLRPFGKQAGSRAHL
jgi:hypothetical protein